MRRPTIRHVATLENAFQKLRNSNAHKGMGTIELTMEDQEALCDIVKNQIFNTSTRCEQLLSFCLWITEKKGGRIEGGKEGEIVWEWSGK